MRSTGRNLSKLEMQMNSVSTLLITLPRYGRGYTCKNRGLNSPEKQLSNATGMTDELSGVHRQNIKKISKKEV